MFKNLPPELIEKIMEIGNEYDIIKKCFTINREICINNSFSNKINKKFPRLVLKEMSMEDQELFNNNKIVRKYIKFITKADTARKKIEEFMDIITKIKDEDIKPMKKIFKNGFSYIKQDEKLLEMMYEFTENRIVLLNSSNSTVDKKFIHYLENLVKVLPETKLLFKYQINNFIHYNNKKTGGKNKTLKKNKK